MGAVKRKNVIIGFCYITKLRGALSYNIADLGLWQGFQTRGSRGLKKGVAEANVTRKIILFSIGEEKIIIKFL